MFDLINDVGKSLWGDEDELEQRERESERYQEQLEREREESEKLRQELAKVAEKEELPIKEISLVAGALFVIMIIAIYGPNLF